MTWYRATYKVWGGTAMLKGSYSRKDMFDRARQFANEKNAQVTITWGTPKPGYGLVMHTCIVNPEK